VKLPIDLDAWPMLPFSRWREKVPKADEGGTTESVSARPNATLTRRAARADLSRQRERRRALSADRALAVGMALRRPALAAPVVDDVRAAQEILEGRIAAQRRRFRIP